VGSKPNLRAVAPDERASAKKPPVVHAKIVDALEGSRRDVLASMRKALARRLDNNEIASNSIASAYKELDELDRQIREIDAAEEADERAKPSAPERRPFDASAL
jgi:hypothetical protein